MSARDTIAEPSTRPGFTLVELMVVLVIIGLLASLTLAGLAGARQRAKIDKTKSTIRKIHEIILPQHESYLRRRVPASLLGASTNVLTSATSRLVAIRTIGLYEMPDSWLDVATSGTSRILRSETDMLGPVYSANMTVTGTIPDYAFTPQVRGYGAYRQSLAATLTHQHRSAECLFMLVSRGQSEADVMEQFRPDEFGDTDNDGAVEFVDGWGRPISFMRWPTGFVAPLSVAQVNDPANRHDPFDPFRAELAAFALTPLIYSAGPDGEDGIVQLRSWTPVSRASIFAVTDGGQRPGEPTSGVVTFQDNITNHDLLTK
jgi:prepilin-type N-terminal cleavage/methylation domain-containing protein